jgi:hypothetical protein
MEKEPNKFGVITRVPNLPLIKITWNKESDAFGKPSKSLSVQITTKIESLLYLRGGNQILNRGGELFKCTLQK